MGPLAGLHRNNIHFPFTDLFTSLGYFTAYIGRSIPRGPPFKNTFQVGLGAYQLTSTGIEI